MVHFLCIFNSFAYKNTVTCKFRHVGYCNESLAPYNNGFQSGLYSNIGLQYHSRGHSRTIITLDGMFGTPHPSIRTLRRQYLGNEFNLQLHDTYRINNSIATPTLQQDGLSANPDYLEDVYTEDIKTYIAGQDGNNPFYLYYSQWVCICYLYVVDNIAHILLQTLLDTTFVFNSTTKHKT